MIFTSSLWFSGGLSVVFDSTSGFLDIRLVRSLGYATVVDVELEVKYFSRDAPAFK